MINNTFFKTIRDFVTIQKIYNISKSGGCYKLESMDLPIDDTDNLILETLSKILFAKNEISTRILTETSDNLPMIQPRGLKLDLIKTKKLSDLYYMYLNYKRKTKDDTEKVQGYKVNKNLYPVNREPIEDENLKAILGSKEIPTEPEKVSVEITKEMVQEAVSFLVNDIDNLNGSIGIKDLIINNKSTHVSNISLCVDKLKEGVTEESFNDVMSFILEKYDSILIDYHFQNTLCDIIKDNIKNAVSIIGAASSYDPTRISETYEIACNNSYYWLSEANNIIDQYLNADINTITLNEGIKEKLTKVKTKLSGNDEKFLKKYSKKALSSNCIGVVIDKWYVAREDLDEKYKKAKEAFNQTYKTTYKNFKDLEDAYNKYKRNLIEDFTGGSISIGKHNKESQIKRKFTDDKFFVRLKTLAVYKEKNHKVTKSDVKWAVNFLNGVEIEIINLQNKLRQAQTSYIANDSSSFIGDIMSLTSEQKAMVRHFNKIKQSGLNEIEINYLSAKVTQMKILRSQARLIIMKASRVKDKEPVKEFMELQNLDEDIFIEMVEDVVEYFDKMENIFG